MADNTWLHAHDKSTSYTLAQSLKTLTHEEHSSGLSAPTTISPLKWLCDILIANFWDPSTHSSILQLPRGITPWSKRIKFKIDEQLNLILQYLINLILLFQGTQILIKHTSNNNNILLCTIYMYVQLSQLSLYMYMYM